MPYIRQDFREFVKNDLNNLLICIDCCSEYEREGVVNYCITRIVARGLRPKSGWRYGSLLRAYGTFHAAAAEFYRRLVGPYEDGAGRRSGDIPEYGEG
jgi:hypothetical protein